MAKAINFGRKEGNNQYNAMGGSHAVDTTMMLPVRAPKYSSSSSEPTVIYTFFFGLRPVQLGPRYWEGEKKMETATALHTTHKHE